MAVRSTQCQNRAVRSTQGGRGFHPHLTSNSCLIFVVDILEVFIIQPYCQLVSSLVLAVDRTMMCRLEQSFNQCLKHNVSAIKHRNFTIIKAHK